MATTPVIYIAHPLGFSPLLAPSLEQQVIGPLREMGFEVIDPFIDCAEYGRSIDLDPTKIAPTDIATWKRFNRKVIGKRNDYSMKRADACYGIFDIDDPGTAADVTFFGGEHNYERPIFAANARFPFAENIATHTNPAAVNAAVKTESVGGGVFEGFTAHQDALAAAKEFCDRFMES